MDAYVAETRRPLGAGALKGRTSPGRVPFFDVGSLRGGGPSE